MHNGKNWRTIALLVLCDGILVNVVPWCALMLRFDFVVNAIPEFYLQRMLRLAPLNTIITLLVFYILGMYHFIWSFIGVSELGQCVAGVLCAEILYWMESIWLSSRLPRSVYFISGMLELSLVLTVRYSKRLYLSLRRLGGHSGADRVRTMVIGAGAAGQVLVQELSRTRDVEAKACCVIDDNPAKWGRYLQGVPIVGGRDAILESVREFDIQQIILAMPSSPARTKREFLEICKNTGCKLKILPGIYQMVNGEVSVSRLRDVEVEELLGREPVLTDTGQVLADLRDKTVLVTGAGGSIGGELCRQIARQEPRLLVLLDHCEETVCGIWQELERTYAGGLSMKLCMVSVLDETRLEQVFARWKPEVVFHTALQECALRMEENLGAAMENNVFGTLAAARCAARYGAARFVLISSEQAETVSDALGASKCLCERIVQVWDTQSDTAFTAVRFGDTLEQECSVISLFRKQIALGGPVTVTDARIVRRFMTVPEAVSLILQAGVYTKGGEIFTLDMGDPVKIDDLARNLIRLSGREPDVEIEVRYVGLRPGERLYEEMPTRKGRLEATSNPQIWIERPPQWDMEGFFARLEELRTLCSSTNAAEMERCAMRLAAARTA